MSFKTDFFGQFRMVTQEKKCFPENRPRNAMSQSQWMLRCYVRIHIPHLVPHSGHFGDVGCVFLLSPMTIAYWVKYTTSIHSILSRRRRMYGIVVILFLQSVTIDDKVIIGWVVKSVKKKMSQTF